MVKTARLSSVIYPNRQVTNYSYYKNTDAPGKYDHRLAQIQNLTLSASNLSTFITYTYDANGIIQTWRKQNDASTPLTSTFGYDAADQLISASVPSAPSVFQNYAYQYDLAGNRTTH